ncbi:hypothetical protein TNCV_414591 [Trichonephila clavipes]|nr:hypothetical protein TNCV_414591 [Trichonephila clavipes]
MFSANLNPDTGLHRVIAQVPPSREETGHQNYQRGLVSANKLVTLAVGSLVVIASDSRLEGLGSTPPNTIRVHTKYVLVKSVGPKSYGLSHERRELENISLPFSSLQKLLR